MYYEDDEFKEGDMGRKCITLDREKNHFDEKIWKKQVI
jgi:hypothetical protein